VPGPGSATPASPASPASPAMPARPAAFTAPATLVTTTLLPLAAPSSPLVAFEPDAAVSTGAAAADAANRAPAKAPAGTPIASPQDFVARMLDHAVAAGRESGIPAPYILGQAALESGWGRREIRGADGTPSHNLFGIKAGRDWRGPVVETLTTEYVNGVAHKSVGRFRAYGSYAEAFSDYAGLLARSPRYATVSSAPDAASFAGRLQAGGYATDPAYARKLTQVINRTLALQGANPTAGLS